MKLKTILLFTLALVSVPPLVHSIKVLSNYGTSFYLGFIRQVVGIVGQPRILIGTNSTSTVNYVVASANSTLSLGGVTSASTNTVPLPVSWLTMDSSYSERHKGVHISANAPIYVVSSLYATGGAVASHLVLPGHQLDVDMYEYIAVSYETLGYPPWSVVLLIGNEENTLVTMTSSVTIELPLNPQDSTSSMFQLQAGFPYTVTLNRLQTLLLGTHGMGGDNDMTGTKIISNKPLTVISGNECAFVPANIEDCEQIAIQIPPVVTWGKEFLLPPIFGRTSGQLYKVVAAHSETIINLTCTISKYQPTTLANVGSSIEINTSSSDYCHLESSDPILVVQFSYGYGTDGTGDPFMMLVPSMGQYSNKFFFRTLTGYGSDLDVVTHFLSVVATSTDFSDSQIVYNSQPISSQWSMINSSNGSVVGYGCGFKISAGDHTLQHINTNKSLLGLAYGYVKYRAYGFPVGITNRLKSSVKFSQLKYILLETQDVINVSVVHIGVSETSVKVYLLLGNETSSGSSVATPGEDFLLLSKEVIFDVGEMVKNVSLEVYNDQWVEFTEKFSIRLLPEDVLLLGSDSTFFIEDNDDFTIGITSATTTTSPSYTLEICVSVTSGILQSDITLSVGLTAAVQGQENKGTSTTELDFSQHIYTFCVKLNLLSLVDETELTDGVTLNASLAVSDELHVSLSPSTTEINVKKVMTFSSTLTVSLYPSATKINTKEVMTSTMKSSEGPFSIPTNTKVPMTQTSDNSEGSFDTLITVGIGAVLIVITATIISCTVITICYCRRAKSQRIITNTMEPPVFQMVDHAYTGMPPVNIGVYDYIKSKTDPLPDLPEEEEYETMKPAPSVFSASTEAKMDM